MQQSEENSIGLDEENSLRQHSGQHSIWLLDEENSIRQLDEENSLRQLTHANCPWQHSEEHSI